jgi:hypothetical protein
LHYKRTAKKPIFAFFVRKLANGQERYIYGKQSLRLKLQIHGDLLGPRSFRAQAGIDPRFAQKSSYLLANHIVERFRGVSFTDSYRCAKTRGEGGCNGATTWPGGPLLRNHKRQPVSQRHSVSSLTFLFYVRAAKLQANFFVLSTYSNGSGVIPVSRTASPGPRVTSP